ncbi:DUF448 domain-containing protein [bacterium]|nr:DUF448 domain-containing protein [bacterium]
MHIPHRQCIACRSRKPKQRLIRIVRGGSAGVRLDRTGRAQGRGCYVCPRTDCIVHARKHDLVSRHLRRAAPPQLYQDLAEFLAALQPRPRQSFLGLAVKAGKTVLGTEAVRRSVKTGTVALVLYEPQASPSTVQRLTAVCRAAGIPALPYAGALPLDQAVGKPNCKAAGITDRQLAQSLIAEHE